MPRFSGGWSLVVIWDSGIVGLLTTTRTYLLINATIFARVVTGLKRIRHNNSFYLLKFSLSAFQAIQA
ncbi:MAG: hypothetical protein DELT_00820 [Desulfovibrio sp.]